MEKQGNEIKNSPKGNSGLWMYIVLGILAVVIIGLSVWLISVKSNMKELLTEKEIQKIELQNELDSVILQHDRIKAAYGEISDSLVSMDSIIQANAKEIKEMLNFKWEYYKIKKKLSRLQVVAQGYVRQMDSIVTINHELTEENLQIKEEIIIEKRKSRQLEEKTEVLTEIVTEAAVLKVYNLTASPMHEKGGGKQVETDKIKRTDLIKVCFTLGENSVVEPGNKALYVRIAEPGQEILTLGRGEEYSFIFQGEQLQYSITEIVDYQKIAQEVCMTWNKRASKELKPGLYHVEIFQGENIIGHTSFTLK